jgi:hypothetical protein
MSGEDGLSNLKGDVGQMGKIRLFLGFGPVLRHKWDCGVNKEVKPPP